MLKQIYRQNEYLRMKIKEINRTKLGITTIKKINKRCGDRNKKLKNK